MSKAYAERIVELATILAADEGFTAEQRASLRNLVKRLKRKHKNAPKQKYLQGMRGVTAMKVKYEQSLAHLSAMEEEMKELASRTSRGAPAR